jgi:hypothetical protein
MGIHKIQMVKYSDEERPNKELLSAPKRKVSKSTILSRIKAILTLHR